jgi:hypothetical protein
MFMACPLDDLSVRLFVDSILRELTDKELDALHPSDLLSPSRIAQVYGLHLCMNLCRLLQISSMPNGLLQGVANSLPQPKTLAQRVLVGLLSSASTICTQPTQICTQPPQICPQPTQSPRSPDH